MTREPVGTVLLAAGRGTRFGAPRPKQALRLRPSIDSDPRAELP